MNFKYHLAVGVMLDLAFGTRGIMTIASVAPDAPLVFNEIRLLKRGESFDPWKVPLFVFEAYTWTHSLLVAAFMFASLGFHFGLAYLIHIICDWFTHTGRFAAQPFYPFSEYRIKFGRDILK